MLARLLRQRTSSGHDIRDAIAAAERAVVLAPELADAHVARGNALQLVTDQEAPNARSSAPLRSIRGTSRPTTGSPSSMPAGDTTSRPRNNTKRVRNPAGRLSADHARLAGVPGAQGHGTGEERIATCMAGTRAASRARPARFLCGGSRCGRADVAGTARRSEPPARSCIALDPMTTHALHGGMHAVAGRRL